MRDKDRMKSFLVQIEEAWKQVPDWRFGQLMYNFFSEMGDPFYWEEEDFAKKLKEYIEKIRK